VRPELRRVGNEQSPVVVIDGFSGDPECIANIAEGLGAFPTVTTGYYPGVRRFIGEGDADSWTYVQECCERAAPFIGGAFNIEGFYLVESSFSMVTQKPADLLPVQRAPHFDSPDQQYYAVLHYLRVPPGTGTAFYRHRSTGIERVTEANVDEFVRAAKAETGKLPTNAGYIQGSNQFYEQIEAVEAIPDRLLIYQGSLLHSGIIPPDMSLSPDPRQGRLTANIFVHGR
jgi:hypothetical protein